MSAAITQANVLAAGAALLAGLAVAAWLSPARGARVPPPRDDALPTEPRPWALGRRPPGWRGVLAGRYDAPSGWRRVLAAAAASLAAVVLIDAVLGPLPGWLLATGLLCATAAGAIGLGLIEPAATGRRSRRLVLDVPQALDLLAACLAAGLPVRNATAAVVEVFDGPVAEDLGYVARAVDVGLSDVAAWRALRDHAQLGEAAVDLARAVESGSRLVETLSYYADQARLRRAAAVESSAKAVGVRCVLPMMICFIPSFILLGVVPATASAFMAALPRIF